MVTSEELLWEEGKLNTIERQKLELAGGSGFDYIPTEEIAKALRIIDAHAADRAALVAQLEAEQADTRALIRAHAEALDRALAERDDARSEYANLQTHVDLMPTSLTAAEAQAALLTRERDEARVSAQQLREHWDGTRWARDEANRNLEAVERSYQEATAANRSLKSEVARLTEALATALAHDQLSRTQRDMLQAEVTRLRCENNALRGQLDGAEEAAEEALGIVLEKLSATEARVRELEADIGTERDRVRRLANNNIDTKAQLAAANALLAELNHKAVIPYTNEGNHLARRVGAHLAAQPATAPEAADGD